MKETFIKIYWSEEDIFFYYHFKDEEVVRQIEIFKGNKVYLTINNPVQGESFLFDQNLTDFELNEEDFITKQEFEEIWGNKDHNHVS